MQKTFWVSSKLTQQSKTCLYVQRTCILETKTQIINCSVLQVIDGVPCKHVIRYANFGNGSCVLTKFYTKWFIEDDFLVCENATRSLVLCMSKIIYMARPKLWLPHIFINLVTTWISREINCKTLLHERALHFCLCYKM